MAITGYKRLLVRVSVVLAFLFGLVLMAPSIISTSWVYEPIVAAFAKDRFSLKIGGIRLAWFSPIEVQSVALSEFSSDAAHDHLKPLLSIESIKTDRGLLSYLLNGKQLGKITVQSPVVDIDLLENESNLQRIVQSIQRSANGSSDPASNQEKAAIDIDVSIIGLSVQVTRSGESKPLVVVPAFDTELSYRASTQDPLLEVKPTQILKEAVLTQELVQLGLGHAVPLLAKSAWFDGRVSLSSGPISIPLDHPVDSRGSATLIMHEVRTGPTEPLVVDAISLLSSLRNKNIPAELVFVNGSQVELGLENKTISHSGLEAGLPTVDERLQVSSAGSVGLEDKALNLLVKVPVPVEQLAQREKVKELGVPQLSLPIRGTLDKPELDWNAFRKDSGLVLSLMAGQLQTDAPVVSGVVGALGGVAEGKADEAIEAAAALVKELRERRQKKAAANSNEGPNDSANGAGEDASKANRRPMLDALRRAIRQP
ncbi:MAG: hypothetical protein MUC43_08050 [Pirellula sp.]|jgi:hypothetical protein|nr:hypothetical protein [Pirellula sp.]